MNDAVAVALTVFFQEPFWIGVFERVEDGRLSACKVTFGAEPKDCEIHEHFHVPEHCAQGVEAFDGRQGGSTLPLADGPGRFKAEVLLDVPDVKASFKAHAGDIPARRNGENRLINSSNFGIITAWTR